MRLRARLAHAVTVGDLDLDVQFAAKEEILTEISANSPPERLAEDGQREDRDLRGVAGHRRGLPAHPDGTTTAILSEPQPMSQGGLP